VSTDPDRRPTRPEGERAGGASRETSGRKRAPGGGFGADAARGMNQASRGLTVAFGFVIVVLLFVGAGRLLDNWAGTDPWGTVVGSIVGWVLGVVVVYYMAQRSLD
jgi:F0F1-type ATP synthase assembly protein I